jgi:hypothetical protein
MFKTIASAATLGLLSLSVLSAPAFADRRVVTTTQGESGNTVPEGAAGNNGIKTTSTNNGNMENTNCNDCGSTGPGNSNK